MTPTADDPRPARSDAPRPRTARFLTHSVPAPAISGDRIRAYHLIRALKARGWTVRVWSLLGTDEPARSDHAVRALADEVVLVDRPVSAAARRRRLVRDLVERRAFQEHWFWSAGAAAQAENWLANAGRDAIVVEQLYMVPYLPSRWRRRAVLDTHNLEAARMRAMAKGEGRLARRIVSRLQVGPVERYERAAVSAFGRVLAVSPDEAASFEWMAPGRVRLVPNGVDAMGLTARTQPTASRELLFLGSLGYSANADAIRFFAEDVATHLAGSGATLTIVGAGADDALRQRAAAASVPTTVAGFVPDVGPVFDRARAMVVPLRHGGGTRLKILESLARGLPVVTTTIGGEGLGLVDGRHALIADDGAAFAGAIRRLLADDDLWRALSQAGRTLAETFDWEPIGRTFEATMTESLADVARAGS